MEEINLKDLFNYFWSKIGIIISVTLVVVLGSCIYSLYIKTPLYRSSTTIVLARVNDSVSETGAITQNDIILNQKLVSTYREIIKSRRILNQVIANLDLDVTYSDLRQKITVTNEEDTELIRISVVDKDSKEAKLIANEIAHVFNNEIVDIYSIKNISIIDYAEEEVTPYNINVVKQTVLSGVIGILLSCGIIFTMFYFDTTIKSADEIESKLGLPLLGAVPMSGHHKGGKK